MSTPTRIFISYAHADEATARSVVMALRNAGLRVWWDEQLAHGQQWQVALEKELSRCEAFLVLIGHQGVSGWVRAEVGAALNRHYDRTNEGSRLPIVPVLLPQARPEAIPPFLSQFQFHELGDPQTAGAIDGLVAALGRDLSLRYRDPAPLPPGECPFPGLGCYDSARQDYFLGRHTEVYAALERLSEPRYARRRRWLRIEGNSGLGKSSLLHAGILPALRQNWVDLGNTGCRLQLLGDMRPGTGPLTELARLLARVFNLHTEALLKRLRDPDFTLADLFAEQLPDPQRSLPLLAIDQFEELFTLSGEHADDRARLDTLLAGAIADDRYPLYLVTTLRSDFVAQFDTMPQLDQQRAGSAHFELPPMGEAGLRDVVLRGAQLAGVMFSDDSLAEDIIREARHEPAGALPLLNNLLRRLWQEGHRTGQLQREYYNTLGGLGGALATSADALLDQLGDRRHLGMDLLLNLVQPGFNTPHARRSISRARALDCVAGDADILDRLSGHAPDRQREGEAIRLITITPAKPEPTEAPSQAGEEVAREAVGNDPVGSEKGLEAIEGAPTGPDQDQVDLIHETLLRTRPDGRPYWPTLWEEISDSSFLRERTRLEQQARAWKENASIVPLAEDLEFHHFAKYRPGASTEVLDYLDASERRLKARDAQRKAEEEQHKARTRKRRWLLCSVACAVALVLAALEVSRRWLLEQDPSEPLARDNLARLPVRFKA
jgi:hypothetical protein